MKLFLINKYLLCIALILGLGYALPSLAYSLRLLIPFNFIAFPNLIAVIAIGVALFLHGKGLGMRLLEWTVRLAILAILLYILLNGIAYTLRYPQLLSWYDFTFYNLLSVLSRFLVIGFVTGLIIRSRKKTASN